jgi:formylglycine-generating enzyme
VTFNPYVPRPIDRPTAVPLDDNADLTVLDEAKIFAAPPNPAQWPAYRRALRRWRAEAADRIGYQPTAYDDAQWVPDARVVALVWLWDELLYDHAVGRFTPSRLLDWARAEFGGFDGIVLWHAYPVIGLDDRNQFDFYRDVPDLPTLVQAFRDAGVRVFIDYNPWDVGTRREPVDDPTAIATLVTELGVDGVFLDTLKEGGEELRAAMAPGVAFESESRVPLARVSDHAMSWAQWFADSPVPGVLRSRWFERRHMVHHTRRWHRSHLEELQSAWLNGAGVLVWDVVFGVWVGWSRRDRDLLKAMRPIWRDYAEMFRSAEWMPLADHPGGDVPVYASRWRDGETSLWTVINRADRPYEGAWLLLDADAETEWVDLIGDVALRVDDAGGGKVTVSGTLPPGGIAAVVAGRPTGQPATSLSDDDNFPSRSSVRVATRDTSRGDVPTGMVTVPGGRHQLTVHYRLRETGLYGEAPYVDEWKPLPPRLHQPVTLDRDVALQPFAIDTREVTVAEFAAFVDATGYQPVRAERLDQWRAYDQEAPVTYVELADARAYAAWQGKRLPTEDEWQVAAEAGLLERLSPLVWNWTESEHTDGRTRFAILKGGAAYRAEGSDWYLDGGPMPPHASVKLLLMGAGMSRSPSIGFRCAVGLSGELNG